MNEFYNKGQERAKVAIAEIPSVEAADTIIWAFYENLMDEIAEETATTDSGILAAHRGYCDLIKSSKIRNTLTGKE